MIATATAAEQPCSLYAYHAPAVTRTQGHHVYPLYLQRRLGVVNDEIRWLCGNCHDSVHEWLSWLLGEAREPSPHPPPRARALAQVAYDWYVS